MVSPEYRSINSIMVIFKYHGRANQGLDEKGGNDDNRDEIHGGLSTNLLGIFTPIAPVSSSFILIKYFCIIIPCKSLFIRISPTQGAITCRGRHEHYCATKSPRTWRGSCSFILPALVIRSHRPSV